MDNPFDQFTGLGGSRGTPEPAAQPANAPGETIANPFDQFTGLGGSRGTEPPKGRGLLRQFPTGFNETLADVAGAPVDAMTWALNRYGGKANEIARAAGASGDIFGRIEHPFGGSESIKRGMGAIGINPDDLPAQTTGERIMRGAGGGAAAMLMPEIAGLRAAKTGGDLAKSIIAGTAGGAGGEGLAEVAPEEYKPAARIVGNVAAGGAAAIAAEGPRGIAQAAAGARRFAEPLTVAGQERSAARTMAERATSRDAALEALDTQPHELVPRSRPTTFQVTGDTGLGQLEREAMIKSPQRFLDRAAEQNAARVGALGNIAPAADPADVSSHLRQSLADLETSSQAAVDRATGAAQGAAARIGGVGTPADYGAQMRGALQDAETTARAHERRLWTAVDPDGTLTVPTNPVRAITERVYGNLTQAAAATLGTAERQILGVIGQYGEVVPFRELGDLRSIISGAMRAELVSAGRTPVYARLSQLRAGVENALSGMAEQRAGAEAQAVASGRMSPEATMMARLQADADAFRAQRRAEVAGAGGGAGATQRGAGAPGIPGTAGPGPVGPGMPPGGAGGAAAPTFDAAAEERLRAATTATRERAQTFGQEPARQILRSQGTQGQYRLPVSSVPPAVFRPGPGGYDRVQAFLRAAGPDAAGAVSDYAAMSLRRAAMNADGTLDPRRYANWARAHQDALRALPNRADFADAARATETVTYMAEGRAAQLRAAQDGAIGRLLGVREPQDVTRIIGGIFGQRNSVQEMARLAQSVRGNPEAWAGLRRAVTDYVYGKFISNAEAATTGTSQIKSDPYQTFLRSNAGALRQVYSREELNMMNAIAADLQRANRSIIATKLPGGSNTPQDLVHKLQEAGTHGSMLTQAVLAAVAGFQVHGAKGALTGIAGVIGNQGLNSMRAAGMEKIDDLIKRAMLDPGLARDLLAKAPAKSAGMPSQSLLNRLARLSLFAVAPDVNQQK